MRRKQQLHSTHKCIFKHARRSIKGDLTCGTPTVLRPANREKVNATTKPACLRHSENKKWMFSMLGATQQGGKSKKREIKMEEYVRVEIYVP